MNEPLTPTPDKPLKITTKINRKTFNHTNDGLTIFKFCEKEYNTVI